MLWSFPGPAVRYILIIEVLAGTALGAAVLTTRWRLGDLAVFGAFVLCGLISVEGSRHLGSPEFRRGRVYKDLLTAWTLPAVLLLPPAYAPLVYLPVNAYAQYRVGRQAPVKRTFNTAQGALAGCLSSWVHEFLAGHPAPYDTDGLVGSARAVSATLATAVILAAVSAALVAGVVHRTAPGATRRQALGSRDDMVIDAADHCLGLLVAVIWTASAGLVAIALPPVLLLQRSLLHGELLQASRTDAKTGLANPGHWREVAEREVARALRGRQPLAVLLVDIDHFKEVNDTVGHLAGDQVLAAVAEALRNTVRPRDLVGRFGGEEFVVLLPEVSADAAQRTAERMREQVEKVRCTAGERRAPVTVTVSIGIAMLTPETANLTSLLAASDTALYQAKAKGRNRVVPAQNDQGPVDGGSVVRGHAPARTSEDHEHTKG
jgi:diguanylate cyclase (GGDEF)-like protein